jgi:outer membrane protein TolC
VAQQSLKLAQDLLEKNKRAVEVGTMAPIDILTAQAEVASREAEILAAEAAVKNRDDRLKQILNISAMDKESQLLNIIPQDSPKSDKKEVKLEEALAVAMQNRPDLQAIRLGLKNSEIDVGYTKNQLLPELNLSISYWSPGVSGDLLIYDPRDPFGPPVQTVPGGRGDSFKDAFGFEYQNWSIGLTLNVPINNIFSRAAYAQAKVNLDQAMLQLKNQEQQVFTDIKIAVRNVETTYKQTQSFKVARELAERQLEAEEEKLKVGLTTNFFVLQYQRDLANARSQELQAIVNYNLALAQLSRDLGVSLQEKNIKISDIGRR